MKRIEGGLSWTDKEIKMPGSDAMENESQLRDKEAEVVEQPGSAGEVEAPEVDEVEKLRNELQEARDEAEEYLDGWRRTQAEFSNYRKRQRADGEQVRELANAGLLRNLLPVLDDFERAIATVPDGIRKLSWIQGLLMVKRKLEVVLESEGVEPIEATGEKFDPYYHEAVTYEEIPGYEEGQIIGEVQQGYVLGDRVLRPALVRVAKAPCASPEEGQEEIVIEGAEE
jgi:molecular chaperone GrpE